MGVGIDKNISACFSMADPVVGQIGGYSLFDKGDDEGGGAAGGGGGGLFSGWGWGSGGNVTAANDAFNKDMSELSSLLRDLGTVSAELGAAYEHFNQARTVMIQAAKFVGDANEAIKQGATELTALNKELEPLALKMGAAGKDKAVAEAAVTQTAQKIQAQVAKKGVAGEGGVRFADVTAALERFKKAQEEGRAGPYVPGPGISKPGDIPPPGIHFEADRRAREAGIDPGARGQYINVTTSPGDPKAPGADTLTREPRFGIWHWAPDLGKVFFSRGPLWDYLKTSPASGFPEYKKPNTPHEEARLGAVIDILAASTQVLWGAGGPSNPEQISLAVKTALEKLRNKTKNRDEPYMNVFPPALAESVARLMGKNIDMGTSSGIPLEDEKHFESSSEFADGIADKYMDTIKKRNMFYGKTWGDNYDDKRYFDPLGSFHAKPGKGDRRDGDRRDGDRRDGDRDRRDFNYGALRGRIRIHDRNVEIPFTERSLKKAGYRWGNFVEKYRELKGKNPSYLDKEWRN